MIKNKIWLVSLLLLAACGTHYPLNISATQWQEMTTEQRLAAQMQQAELGKAEAERRWQAQQVLEVQRIEQQQHLEHARHNAAYGDRVQCILKNTEVKMTGRWRSVEPVVLDLVKGAPVTFVMHHQEERAIAYRTSAQASFDGLKVTLCHDLNRPTTRTCAQLLGTQADYRRGITDYIQTTDFIRGQLRCEMFVNARSRFRS